MLVPQPLHNFLIFTKPKAEMLQPIYLYYKQLCKVILANMQYLYLNPYLN